MKKKGLLLFASCLLSLCACEIRGVPSLSSNNNDVSDSTDDDNEENNDNSNNNNTDIGEATDDFGKNAVKLSFKSASSFEYLKTLNNKQELITQMVNWTIAAPAIVQ